MGLKLQTVLIVTIVAILALTLSVEIKNSKGIEKAFNKEMEFTDTIFREVDTEKIQGVAFATYGIRNAGILTVDNLRYHTDSIERLTAKKGRYIGERIFLDYNITVHQKEGFDYKTEHAVYNQKTEVLDILSPFSAVINGNIFHGKTLRYHSKTKEAFATMVDAVVYTKEK